MLFAKLAKTILFRTTRNKCIIFGFLTKTSFVLSELSFSLSSSDGAGFCLLFPVEFFEFWFFKEDNKACSLSILLFMKSLVGFYSRALTYLVEFWSWIVVVNRSAKSLESDRTGKCFQFDEISDRIFSDLFSNQSKLFFFANFFLESDLS